MNQTNYKRWIALFAIQLMLFTQIVEAATVTLSTSPLANKDSASVVRPNIMFVLDNSGSTQWDYLPDYVSSGSAGTGSQICWSGNNDSSTRSTCSTSGSTTPLSSSNMTGTSVQIPLTSPDINYIYYNSDIYYQPPIKADKTSYPANSPTAASSNGFSSTTGSMNFKTGTTIASLTGTTTNGSTTVTGLSSSVGLVGSYITAGTGIPSNTYVAAAPTATTITLSAAATASGSTTITFQTGGYPHQVFCNTSAPTTQQLFGGQSGTVCQETTDTTTSSTNLLPNSTYGTAKSYSGPAYYYTMSTHDYCKKNVDGTTDFTQCQTTADATHVVEFKYLWCNAYVSNTATFSGCQDLRDTTHTIPDYLGGIVPTAAPVQSSASLTINSYIPGKSITSVTVFDGTTSKDIVGGTTFTAGSGGLTSTGAIATAICNAVHVNTAFSGYDCPTAPAANTLVIKANIPPTFPDYITPNGYSVLVNSSAPFVAGSAATGTVTITNSGAVVVNDISIGGVSVMTTKPYYFGPTSTSTNIASTLASLIGSGYTASATGSTITITSTSLNVNVGAITLTTTPVAAKATVTANSSVGASGGSIGAITVSGTTLENPQTFAANASTTTVATQIKNNVIGATGFSAAFSSNVATFTAPAGNAFNGQTIAIAAPAAPTSAVGTLPITISGATEVDDIKVNGTSVLGTKPYYFGDNDTSTSANCTKLATLVTANGFTGTCSGTSTLTLTGPAGNTSYNGTAIVMSGTAISAKANIVSTAAVSATQPGSIAAITAGLGGTTIEAAQIFATSSASTAVATQIKNGPLLNGFTATSLNSTATITAPAGNAFNNVQISIQAGTTLAAAAATGSITVVSTTGATNIQDITANGTTLLAAGSKPMNFANGTQTSTIASSICTAIESFKATSGYGCPSASGATVNILATTTGPAKNGPIVVTTNTSAGSSPTASISFTSVASSPGNVTITAGSNNTCSVGTVTLVSTASFNPSGCGSGNSNTKRANNITDLLLAANAGSATATAGWTDASGSCSGIVTYSAPIGTANNGWFLCRTFATPANFTTNVASPSTTTFSGGVAATTGQSTTNVAMAGGTVGQYNYSPSLTVGTFPTATSGGSATPTANSGYAAATGSGSMNNAGTVSINYSGSLTGGTFPAATNVAAGSATATTNAGYGALTFTSSGALSGGVLPTGVISTNASATAPSTLLLSGGLNGAGGHTNVGKFKRVDIVPSVNSYPATGTKNAGRTDCAGTTCTYAEELQNFANWYSYYRHRQNLMKSSSTLAFDKLNSKYRVGFDLLSHYQTGKIDLEVAQFVDTGGETALQRTNWWNNLINSATSGSTPLRSEVLKIGKYYAGALTAPGKAATAETRAKASFKVNSTTSNGGSITSLTLEGVPLLGSAFIVSGCSSPCSTTQRTTVASNLATAMNTYIASSAYTSLGYPNYSVSASSGTLTITAPVGSGSSLNGNGLTISTGGTGSITISNVVDMAGGIDAVAATPATTIEPIQYSCQQNFTLLVTDGYWNSDSYTNLTQIDGTTLIGNQDNVNSSPTARPRFDGAVAATSACTDSNYSSCGTLADVTEYFYKTDLRDPALGNNISAATGLDVSENNVFKSADDSNQQQHMVFFGMGLGVPGTLRYSATYQTDTSGDYFDINNPDINGNYKNWPAPKQNDPTTIDDLWHASVNGNGRYFSARDPVSVSKGFSDTLTSINARTGSAAAAATSSLQQVQGDNFAYVGNYQTVNWVGNLEKRTIDLITGNVSEDTDCGSTGSGCIWAAQSILDAATWSTRNIYMTPTSNASGATPRLFTYANLANSTEQGYFDPSSLSQYSTVNAVHASDITASNLVDFLRGDRSLESTTASGHHDIWRLRTHVLGDIVNTQPVFVKRPAFSYTDAGFSAYVASATVQNRDGVVYVSANDGMLHAFDADSGSELWAFIPKAVLPNIKILADTSYTDLHAYFVDGPISVGDVNFGGSTSDWHTILVGGFGRGAKGYYAMDITDPQNPKYLWEFSDTNLGYSYGNPSINKLPNGDWAVFVSSGYNNADGKGYLYALNPKTGAIKSGFPLSTGSGTATSPSNLGKLSSYITDLQSDNTADYMYAGDLNGDLWRFDLNPSATGHSGVAVLKLAHLQNAAGTAQPITTRPELSLVSGIRVVYVGTGEYLGDPDLQDTSTQSFYAIKDTLGAANLGGSTQATWNPRTDTGTVGGSTVPLFAQRKLISKANDGSQILAPDGSIARKICSGTSSQISSTTGNCINESGASVNFTDYGGWFVDFPESGERMNVDMNLTLGTLTIGSNIPASSACTTGGSSFLNYIDFRTGLSVAGASGIASKYLANALIVGINVIQLPDGTIGAIVTTSDDQHITIPPPVETDKFQGKRNSWRELDLY